MTTRGQVRHTPRPTRAMIVWVRTSEVGLFMRVLFIQQDHVSPTGHIGAGFADQGYQVETLLVVPEERFTNPNVTVTFPDPRHYDAIVPMGAPWSVYDDSTIGSWIADELAFLRSAHEFGVPVLGICFGGQALAAALGGGVELSLKPELGWTTIETDEPDLVEPGPWFQFHHDRWSLPPAARELARTEVASQAFVLGRSLGVQFHPEVTAATLQGWNDTGGAEYLAAHGVDVDDLMAQTRAEEDHARRRAERLVDRFLERVATRTPTAIG
jgi:GMP synthase-like glutamine amidotransferase